jgi:hypothetical protein
MSGGELLVFFFDKIIVVHLLYYIRYRQKREKKRLTFKMWTREGGRGPSCVGCSCALKNPQIF